MITRRKFLQATGAYALLGTSLLQGCNDSSFKDKSISTLISLPDGAMPHQEEVEWWYWTGHLKTADERWFGFQFVIFLMKISNDSRILVAHHAITDIENNSFHYVVTPFKSIAPPVFDSGFNWQVDNLKAKGGNDIDILHAEVDGFISDLTLESTKPFVSQHGNGYTEYSVGGYTYYYSKERLKAKGTIKIGNEVLAVTGEGWFDHQWGELTQLSNSGWDWFAIQLDDNREIMLFNAHKSKTESILVGGSFADAQGKVREIEPSNIEITALSEWVSPKTNIVYPQNWQIRVEDLTFTVTVTVADQEVRGVPIYWEGASTVSGDVTGRAYVELAGYHL